MRWIATVILILVCQVGWARDRSVPVPTGGGPASPGSLPTEPIPFSYSLGPNDTIQVPKAVMVAYLQQQTAIKLAAADEVARSTVKVVQARVQVEANTQEIQLANVQRELDNEKLKQIYAWAGQMYEDGRKTAENLVQTQKELASTRGELQTTRNHLGATQGELQGAQGALGQASQMIDKMRSRAILPFPISTIANIFDPI